MNFWNYAQTYQPKALYSKKKNKSKKNKFKRNKNERKYIIYKIIINDLIYIGQTNNLERRLKEHKEAAFDPTNESYNFKLAKAIREYGVEKLIVEIIHKEIKEKCMNFMEIEEIAKHNSYENGLNSHPGGDFKGRGPNKRPESKRSPSLKIIKKNK